MTFISKEALTPYHTLSNELFHFLPYISIYIQAVKSVYEAIDWYKNGLRLGQHSPTAYEWEYTERILMHHQVRLCYNELSCKMPITSIRKRDLIKIVSRKN